MPAETVVTEALTAISTEIEKSIHLIVVEAKGNRFDFATAWEASRNLLVTNAHVVESLKKNAFEFSAIRAFDQSSRDVTSTGVHPAYRKCVSELTELTDQSASLRKEIEKLAKEKASQSDLQPMMDRWRDMRRRRHWLRLRADCYDVGWIHVNSLATGTIVSIARQNQCPYPKRKKASNTPFDN